MGRATAFNKTSAHESVLQPWVMFAHSVSNGLVPLLYDCQQEHFERQGFSLRFLRSVGPHAIVSCTCLACVRHGNKVPFSSGLGEGLDIREQGGRGRDVFPFFSEKGKNVFQRSKYHSNLESVRG